MYEELKQMIKDCKGGYQPVEIDDEHITDGWRACEDRWNIIKQRLKQGQVIMDIGSYFGYFGVKIAREFSKSLVWSIEANGPAVNVQREVIKLNKLNNILLSHRALSVNDLLRLSRTAEGIDVILALSVLHEWPRDQLRNILYLFSRIAPELIIEVDNKNETYPGKQDIVSLDYNNILRFFYDDVQLIGHSKSVKGFERPIYYCKNKQLIKNNVTSYFTGESGFGNPAKRHNIKFSFDNWVLDDRKEWTQGLNLSNMLHFNLIWPENIIHQAACEWFKIKDQGPTDITLKNVLITAQGLKLIDYTELKGTNNVYGLSDEEYNKQVNDYSLDHIESCLKEQWTIQGAML